MRPSRTKKSLPPGLMGRSCWCLEEATPRCVRRKRSRGTGRGKRAANAEGGGLRGHLENAAKQTRPPEGLLGFLQTERADQDSGNGATEHEPSGIHFVAEDQQSAHDGPDNRRDIHPRTARELPPHISHQRYRGGVDSVAKSAGHRGLPKFRKEPGVSRNIDESRREHAERCERR